MAATAAQTDILPEDRLRADLYDFLAALLSGPPSAELLRKCAALSGDETPLGRGIGALARVAQSTSAKAVESEFNALFIGLGRGELLPYASYYMTGFLNEKPLALLRQDMSARGMRRADSVFEPEDNIASLFEMMAGLILGRFRGPASLEDQKVFFNKHIGPWAAHMFQDLEGAKASVFYATVGAVGRAFTDIEKEAFRMTAGDTPA